MKKWFLTGMILAGIMFGASVKVESYIGNCEYSLDGISWKAIEYGMEIPVSAKVRVPGKKDSLLLAFEDGSTIQLLGTTVVEIASLQKDASSKNLLKLTIGKLFASVIKKKELVFEVETDTAVAAVRGTRFGVGFAPGQGGEVIVSEGTVEVFDPGRTQQPKLVNAGEKLVLPATAGPLPNPVKASPEEIRTYDENYQPPAPAVEKPTPTPTPTPSPVQETPPTPKPAPAEPKKAGGFGFDWVIGGENIDGKIWNKVILSPVLRLGNFGVGLYLPVYFLSFEDLGYADRWYNAHEWDFSSFESGVQNLLLKIRFLEYQNKWLLFRIGSLPNMTLGHGILINNYANDLQFPAVRKVGGQIRMDFNTVGFEVLTGNAFTWDMAGARFFVRPFFGKPIIGKLGFGVSGFYDRMPNPLFTNQQIVFGYGADIDLPIFEFGEMLSMVLYSDIATLGYQDKVVNFSTNMQGWGWATGLKGSLIVLDYRAEYRYLKDGFLINYVDTMYDVTRTTKYMALLGITNLDYSGFLVEAGKQFKGLGWVNLRYEHLYPLFSTASSAPINMLHMEAGIEKGVLKWGYGSLAYDRMNFNLSDLFSSFPGEGSVVSAQVYYAISPGAFLGIQFKRYYERDLITGELVAKDTFGVNTQMGF